MAETREEAKSFLMKVKDESEKLGLKLNIQKLRSWHRSHRFMANRWGNSGRLFWRAPKSLKIVTAAMKLKDTYSLEENL